MAQDFKSYEGMLPGFYWIIVRDCEQNPYACIAYWDKQTFAVVTMAGEADLIPPDAFRLEWFSTSRLLPGRYIPSGVMKRFGIRLQT